MPGPRHTFAIVFHPKRALTCATKYIHTKIIFCKTKKKTIEHNNNLRRKFDSDATSSLAALDIDRRLARRRRRRRRRHSRARPRTYVFACWPSLVKLYKHLNENVYIFYCVCVRARDEKQKNLQGYHTAQFALSQNFLAQLFKKNIFSLVTTPIGLIIKHFDSHERTRHDTAPA